MSWKPSNEPARVDRRRVGTLKPIESAIERLRLPLLRSRKLRAICNAIELQIEDGGDSPAVNDLLLDALRAAVLHQVTETEAEPVLSAIERFQRTEARHWEQVRAGTLPPPPPPANAIEQMMEESRQLLQLESVQEIFSRKSDPGSKLAELTEVIKQEMARSHAPPPDEAVPLPPPVRPASRPGRNDPCWCGSGKKYKRCHLEADQADGGP